MTFINKQQLPVNYRNVLTANPPMTYLATGVSGMALPANNDRVGLLLVNLSDKDNIYLGIGYPAEVNSGVTLLPQIGWKMDEFTFCVDAIYAITDGDSVNMSIQEFVQ